MPLSTSTFQGEGELLGTAVGQCFSRVIHAALDENATLRDVFVPYHRGPEGQALFRRLVDLHRARYPLYLSELEGIAEGAGVDFERLFLVNLRGEYRGYTGADDGGECSTCAVVNDDCAAFGHNEDGTDVYKGRSYLIRVEPSHDVAFTALCYPGFLPGNAFGCNDHGLCFSVNNVRPRQVQDGVGRHFMARSLFAARDIHEAIARLSVPDRAAGFNYTLGSIAERRIVNVEVAPHRVQAKEIQGAHFHANHYLYLDTPQHVFDSSRARQQRGNLLVGDGAARNTDGVLRVLRNQSDPGLPIWRDGTAPDSGVTLLTGLFDLDARELVIYAGPWQHEHSPETPLARVPINVE